MKAEKSARTEVDASGTQCSGFFATTTLVTVMPELNTKVVALSTTAVLNNNSCHGPSPIHTAKGLSVWSATQRIVRIESPAEVPLMSTSEIRAASQLMRSSEERRVAHLSRCVQQSLPMLSCVTKMTAAPVGIELHTTPSMQTFPGLNGPLRHVGSTR